MADMINNFFKDLYTSQVVNDVDMLLQHVPCKVAGAMNEELVKPYMAEEIKNTLFQMFPTKAPGSYGFLTHFFQKHWGLCGEEITQLVLRVLKAGDTIEVINNTFIVLIPKVSNPAKSTTLSSDPLSFITRFIKWCQKGVAEQT